MLTIKYENSFKKEYKKMLKRGCDPARLEEVLSFLVNQTKLPPRYKEHVLSSRWDGLRECHITPDWLLIYCIDEEMNVLHLIRTGTHSDLF